MPYTTGGAWGLTNVSTFDPVDYFQQNGDRLFAPEEFYNSPMKDLFGNYQTYAMTYSKRKQSKNTNKDLYSSLKSGNYEAIPQMTSVVRGPVVKSNIPSVRASQHTDLLGNIIPTVTGQGVRSELGGETPFDQQIPEVQDVQNAQTVGRINREVLPEQAQAEAQGKLSATKSAALQAERGLKLQELDQAQWDKLTPEQQKQLTPSGQSLEKMKNAAANVEINKRKAALAEAKAETSKTQFQQKMAQDSMKFAASMNFKDKQNDKDFAQQLEAMKQAGKISLDNALTLARENFQRTSALYAQKQDMDTYKMKAEWAKDVYAMEYKKLKDAMPNYPSEAQQTQFNEDAANLITEFGSYMDTNPIQVRQPQVTNTPTIETVPAASGTVKSPSIKPGEDTVKVKDKAGIVYEIPRRLLKKAVDMGAEIVIM